MKLTISWLKEWVDTQLNARDLALKLTMAGLEVDALSPVCADFKGVVVGKVICCTQHKNADKLQVCQVDIGSDNPQQIICAAPNVRAGLTVAVAKVRAKLPTITIKKLTLRGVVSAGMLCSAAELGLATDLFGSEGILELPAELVAGQDLREVLNLDDEILSLDITPNRGDCFSVLGVAREVAVCENLPLLVPKINDSPTINEQKNIHLKQPQACPRYLSQIIKGVDNTVKTPRWIVERLVYAGQKSHSLVVDITNYVLLELGQPLHAFDLAKVKGDLSVDFSQGGESLILLGGQNITLDKKTLLIKDEHSILAIAGIMGGWDSATTESTQNILLESAFFDPVFTASVARNYNLCTESSLRFERGVDFNGQQFAIKRATQLIINIAGGQAGPIVEVASKANLPKLPTICLCKNSISRILGFELKSAWIVQQFNKLLFTIKEIKGDNFYITPASFRFDISIERDLIEELARLYGYDKLPTQALTYQSNISTNHSLGTDYFSQQLIHRGYTEVISYSFISTHWHQRLYQQYQPLTLANPISNEMSVMRTGLLAGLLQTLINNRRYGQKNVKIFEAGLCFFGLEVEQQQPKIAGVIAGDCYDLQWADKTRPVDFYDIKSDVELLLSMSATPYEFVPTTTAILHSNQGADIVLNGDKIGFVGALSPIIEADLSLHNIFVFEVALSAISQKKDIKYKPFLVQQSVSRDISILIDKSISYNTIKSTILALKQPFLIDFNVFDVYTEGAITKGNKSLSLNLVYQADKTLVDKEIDTLVFEVVRTLSTVHRAVLR